MYIPSHILGFKGQCVNRIEVEKEINKLTIICHRDNRFNAIDPVTGMKGKINNKVNKAIRDIPIFGFKTFIEVERAQVRLSGNIRRLESLSFADSNCFYTLRFCYLVSGLCRHMSIQAVARHLKLRWENVKNMDKFCLEQTLPDLLPEHLKELSYIGVDEVARAKGHDYMTVIYNMVSGRLIGVETGRKAEVLINYLKRIPETVRKGIKAVAMDMGRSYQKAVKEMLPDADIVFDRFHVMQNYSKVIKNQRRSEFRRAAEGDKELIKGSLYLLLKNTDKLSTEQQLNLNDLLQKNTNLNILYVLKEQLQSIWSMSSNQGMQVALENWCKVADTTDMFYLKKFAQSLRNHRTGICNYAKHQLTSGRIEAGNVAIGMIRKRARGIKDLEYFKLKIRQTAIPDDSSMFYDFSDEILA
jgi:transposase